MGPVPPRTLVTLPTGLHVEIFKHLEICASICLGLACKKFWEIHNSQRRVVKLYKEERSWRYGRKRSTVWTATDLEGRELPLGELPKQWMGPNYWLPFRGYKFLPTWKHLGELQGKRDREANERRKWENRERIEVGAKKRKADRVMGWRERGILRGQRRIEGAVCAEGCGPSFSLREGAMV